MPPRLLPRRLPRRGVPCCGYLPRCFSTSRAAYKKKKDQGPPVPDILPDDPVTLTEVMARRRRAGRLQAGTAAGMASSKFIRSSAAVGNRPLAMSWDDFLSLEARSRHPCTLKAAAKEHLSKPNLISLGGGLPSPNYFPIEGITMMTHMEPFFAHLAGNPFTSIASPVSKRKKAKMRGAPTPTIAIRQEDVSPSVRKRAVNKDELKNGHVYDLTVAMNYAQASGSPQMVRFVTEQTEVVHQPRYRDWACALTPGSTAGLEQSFRLLCERGSSLITDEFAFSTALETARPLGVKVFGVEMDGEGMLPSALGTRLDEWSEEKEGAPKPKVLYVVPTGHNPTGSTMSAQRRREIYQVAEKHNLIIIEDDPYYFLQFNDYSPASMEPDPLWAEKFDEVKETISKDEYLPVRKRIRALERAKSMGLDSAEANEALAMLREAAEMEREGEEEEEAREAEDGEETAVEDLEDPTWDTFLDRANQTKKGRLTVTEYVRRSTPRPMPTVACPPSPQDAWLRTLIPSFLSIDTSGRVLRLDSFSKTLIPGLRMGWVTAPKQVVEKFIQHSEVCSQGPSGLSQVLTWLLLDTSADGWGHDGYIEWLSGLRHQYRMRRDSILDACDEFLEFEIDEMKGLVKWDEPQAGMYIWFTIDHTRHPDAATKSIAEIEDEIFQECAASNVLLGKGSWFQAEEGKEPTRLCFRATYAAASPENMRRAIVRFSAAIRKVFNFLDGYEDVMKVADKTPPIKHVRKIKRWHLDN